MSRTMNVIRNKNKREAEEKLNRKQGLEDMRLEAAFRAKLSSDMQCIDVMLEDDDVEAVIVTIPAKYISQYQKAIYSEEMAGYEIKQLDADKFEVGRKILDLGF